MGINWSSSPTGIAAAAHPPIASITRWPLTGLPQLVAGAAAVLWWQLPELHAQAEACQQRCEMTRPRGRGIDRCGAAVRSRSFGPHFFGILAGVDMDGLLSTLGRVQINMTMSPITVHAQRPFACAVIRSSGSDGETLRGWACSRSAGLTARSAADFLTVARPDIVTPR